MVEEFLKKKEIVPNDLKLYEIALSHSSYANEHKDKKNYERLEFLGDAVLELVVSEYLYKNYEQDEGDMTKTRANYVCENANFAYMNDIGLIKYIKVGNGEVNDIKKAIIADIFEAFIGAIYLDQGMSRVYSYIKSFIYNDIKNADLDVLTDYKTKLQELVQADSRRVLKYVVLKENGTSNNPLFEIGCYLDDVLMGTGKEHSKKKAEQLAAREALDKLAI